MVAISQAGVFVRPVLKKLFHVAVCRDEAMRPEGNSTLIQATIDVTRRRFEDAGSGYDHLKFTIHASEACQHSVANFTDQLHR